MKKTLLFALIFTLLTPSAQANHDCHYSHDSCGSYGYNSYDAEGAAIVLVGLLTLLPLYGPYFLLEKDAASQYPEYPFQKNSGYATQTGKALGLRTSYVHQRVEGKALSGFESSVFIQRAAIDVRWNELQNQETLGTHRWHITPSFILGQNIHWQFRAGLGYEEWKKDLPEGRLKMLYGIRLFYHPFQASLDFSTSVKAGQKPIFEIAPAVSVHINRFELKGGYRSIQTGSIREAGPEVSIGMWF